MSGGEVYERRKKVYELRCQGITFRAIAEALGTATPTAHYDFTWWCANEPEHEDPQINRKNRHRLSVAQLDEVIAGIMPAAMAGDVKAANCYAALCKRQSELMGMDAPKEVSIKTTQPVVVTLNGVDINEL